MTKGPSQPEYIPSKEERRQNRERARSASPERGEPGLTAGEQATAADVPAGQHLDEQPPGYETCVARSGNVRNRMPWRCSIRSGQLRSA